MDRKKYEAMRQELINKAQKFINESNPEKAQETMEDIQKLDEKFEAITQAQANFNALNKEPAPIFEVIGNYQGGTANAELKNAVEAWESDVYLHAWANKMQGKALTADEDKAFRMVNEAYTHTTSNTGIVIPKQQVQNIWEEVGGLYPYFNNTTKTHVSGIFSMIQEDTSSDAKWYDEATVVEDGKETFKEFQLSGCELARTITVSWKLKEMAMEDFIPYITRKMAKKIGAAAGYGVTHGLGAKADTSKPEPMGVVTALLAEEGTPQVVTYATGTIPEYKDLIATRAKIKSGYGNGLAIYANSNTIWNVIANIVDANKRPIFMADAMNGGFRVLGMAVLEDDSMLDGEILMSNAEQGYHANVNKEMSMLTEEHVKARTTDYCAYAIMDGNIVTSKAHALLVTATA